MKQQLNGEKAKQMKSPTSKDVARSAGVSQTSVSRVFNEQWSARVSEDLREKVMRAARELNYSPNAIARGLVIRRTGIIGVVVSENFSAFYYSVLNELTNAFQANGMRIMVFNIAPDHDINQIITRLTQYQVDGIVITSAALVNVMSSRWIQKGLPLVVFNAHIPGLICSNVYCDNFSASAQAARHLYETGRRRFAYVSSAKSAYSDNLLRRAGFLSGLKELDIEDCMVYDGDFTYESGLEAGRQFFQGGVRPDAVFCGGELMACGVMDAARLTYGLRVPEDVAVAGYEDSGTSLLKSYDLTAVRQPVKKMVENTVSLLLEQIEQSSISPRSICEPAELMIRSSTVK